MNFGSVVMDKIIKGDTVISISGRDKGRVGSVEKKIGQRVVVSGISLSKRHEKPNQSRGIVGGVTIRETSIDISNVAIFNIHTQKADKVSIVSKNIGNKLKRIRAYKSTGVEI